MGLFRRRRPSHFVPIHRDNVSSKDWVILLEAGTIVGPSPERLRVARTTQERKVTSTLSLFRGRQYFLVMEGYDPRIHGVYFCPQLYRYDSERKLVPLLGEEIGKMIAHALASGIRDRRPWYEPGEKRPVEPVISAVPLTEFDTLVVDGPRLQTADA
jgi:hypothetical protein